MARVGSLAQELLHVTAGVAKKKKKKKKKGKEKEGKKFANIYWQDLEEQVWEWILKRQNITLIWAKFTDMHASSVGSKLT